MLAKDQLKRAAKRAAIPVVQTIGRHLSSPAQRRFLCNRVAPLLMDERVLPAQRVVLGLRFLPVRVPADPYVYTHRNAFWCGMLIEEELEAFMRREIRRGDTFIDVGTNVGHMALPAAALVGAAGKVYAFEPQPELADLVESLAREQGFSQLVLHRCGLGEREGELVLQVNPNHLGGATFRESALGTGELDGAPVERLRCPITRGDDLLSPESLPGRVFLKVDAEGYELPVLRGMEQTLARVDYAVVEVTPQWLGVEGVRELFGLMSRAGLQGYELLHNSAGKRCGPEEVDSQRNILFERR